MFFSTSAPRRKGADEGKDHEPRKETLVAGIMLARQKAAGATNGATVDTAPRQRPAWKPARGQRAIFPIIEVDEAEALTRNAEVLNLPAEDVEEAFQNSRKFANLARG
ncbi:hypothetical protein MES4922_620001 [Mesorhizobium ventifaucium]|uniref:Uncharacterized protein n=1 Tax=Mesorhizobium ventifaucium TaxID=666020 RepID=A0ABM9EEW1_9HYPH|nr:hypothetical protein MES4922_620001 [Mesorhizobium ventifaucium]